MDATEGAFESIRSRLASGHWAPGERLPPLAELAALCSVSTSTMWRALSRLKAQALVNTRRGGAIVAGPAGVVRTIRRSRGLAWRRLKERIGQEIIFGSSWESELPPINKTARLHGVAIGTCRKALEGLVAEGLLVREGRRFRKAAGRLARYKPTIVLFADGDSDRGISIFEPRIEHIVESFEREGIRLGFEARCEGYNVLDPSALLKANSRLALIDRSTGYIVNLWNPGTVLGWRRWVDLLQTLLDRGSAVVAFDQDGGLSFPAALLEHPRFRVLRIVGERAGEMVGHALLQRGHTRFAYLMPFSNWDWAQKRFTGLSQCIMKYGPPKATVEMHKLHDDADAGELSLATLDLDEQGIRTLFRDRWSAEKMREFADHLAREPWLEFKKRIGADPGVRLTRSMARFIAGVAGEPRDQWVFETMVHNLEHIASNVASDRYVESLLGEVLQESSATAWVCAEDKTAINAVFFLRGKGTRVPEDLSVIGFENYREAHEQQLSSFDFNMNSMVQQALQMVMDQKSLAARPVISEVDGYVVERRTTGRPAKMPL